MYVGPVKAQKMDITKKWLFTLLMYKKTLLQETTNENYQSLEGKTRMSLPFFNLALSGMFH